MFDMHLLKGKVLPFYGVDNTKFKVGNVILQAIEDPDDGCRSCLGSIETVEDDTDIFFKTPIAPVLVSERTESIGRYSKTFEGWQLIDAEDGHVWLVVGTEDIGNYYPGFFFEYFPKEPK